MRGRHRRGPNPLTRAYESNGPDVKVRGTATTVAEKYVQLARDAHSSGDHVLAEAFLQHAEHYYRLIAAAQAQQHAQMGGAPVTDAEDEDDEFEVAGADRFTFRPPQAFQNPQGGMNGHGGMDSEGFDGEGVQPQNGEAPGAPRPFPPREARHPQQHQPRPPFGQRDRFRGRERFGEERGERFQGQEARQERGPERPRDAPPERAFERDRSNDPRGERPRFERGDRPFRGDRGEPREAAEPPRLIDPAEQEQPELPAFIRAPLRAAASDEAPAPRELAPVSEPDTGGEVPMRARRRRRPRAEDSEAVTPEGGTEA